MSPWDEGLKTCSLFHSLPIELMNLRFQGGLDNHINSFAAEEQGQPVQVISAMIIRQDEKFFWESCYDLLDRSIKSAALRVSGVFQFHLLSFDAHHEIKSFHDQELAALIINHARKLKIGQQGLIKYSSCYAMLKKLSHEDWGKVVFRPAVEIFAKEPRQLDLLIKRLVKTAEARPAPRIMIVQDLSQQPLLGDQPEEQQMRLKRFFSSLDNLFEPGPRVFMLNRQGIHDLPASQEVR